MHRRLTAIGSVLFLLAAACAPAAPPAAPTAAPPTTAPVAAPTAAPKPTTAPAAVPTTGSAPAAATKPAAQATAGGANAPAAGGVSNPALLQQLIDGAKKETVLKASWSPSSFGGSAGWDRLVAGMNKKYGLNIQAQFTPGIDEQAMVGKLAQEAAAGQPASEDVYLGNPAGVHDAAKTKVLKPVDWRSIIDQPLNGDPSFDPIAPNNAAAAFASSIVGITYNTNLVKAADVPHHLDDLMNPKWKGKIASTPYASGWREFVASNMMGQEATFAFVKKFAPQVGGLIRCGETDRITSGEFVMLAMDCGANDVITLKRTGAPVDHAVLDDYAVVHNRYGGVPVNSSSPNAAALMVAYLETPEAQAILWDVDGLDFYMFPETNMHKAIAEVQQAGGKVVVDSPQWLDSLPNFNDTQKQLGDILKNGS